MVTREFPVAESPTLRERAERWLAAGDPVTPVEPRSAATVMVVRDGSTSVEVFMLRRVATMAFAPRMMVFPGGGVDPRDADPDLPWAGPSPAEWAALMQVDTTGDRAVVSVRAGGPALIMDPRWSPDGDRVAYIRLTPYVGDRSVYTVDARGGDQRRLPLEAGTPLRLDWSPGGRLAAVVIAHEAGVLVELHQDGTSAGLMTDPGAGEPQDGPVAWRPAG